MTFFSVDLMFLFLLLDGEIALTREESAVEDDVKDTILVQLMPTPYPISEDHERLTSLSWEERKELCSEKLSQMNETVFQYVPEVIGDAHLYKFDNEEHLLAIRCDTLPAVYVGLPASGTIPNERWYIRSVKPPIRNWTFTTEVVETISMEKSVREFFEWKSRLNIFHTIAKVERWLLCNEARRMTRYETQVIYGKIETAEFYSYSQDDRSETYLTIVCPTLPRMFLRCGTTGVENEITITFRRADVVKRFPFIQ